MQDAWYGDKRDLIKWGTLVHLARRHGVRTIIQIAFRRLSERPRLESDGRDWHLAEEVWSHFRSLRAIRGLGRRCGLEIRVLEDWFDPKERDRYLRKVVAMLAADTRRKVVLLDPDIGIAPTKRTGSHVGLDEVAAVWEALSRRDWLVLYQHGRRVKGWQDPVRTQFARACNAVHVSTFVSESVSDVAFFAAAKR